MNDKCFLSSSNCQIIDLISIHRENPDYMKKTCSILFICLSFIMTASIGYSENLTTGGPEDQMDLLVEDYIKLLKSTFAEKDDLKSISILKSGSPSLKARFDKLKPELEKWVASMTDGQQEQFKERLQTKPYIITLFFLMNDEKTASRIENNADLEKALYELGSTLGSPEMYERLLK
jgi:hypothetical protein